MVSKNFVLDDAHASFQEFDEMRSFVQEREAHTSWDVMGVKDPVFEEMPELPIGAPVFAQKMGVSTEAVEDTMWKDGTGLKVTMSGGTLPVGRSAISSICNRAALLPQGFERLRAHDRAGLATVVNLLMQNSTGTVVVKTADEKLRAIHSSKYAYLESDKLMDIVKDYLDKNWPNAGFVSGYFSHEYLQMVVDLSAYKQQFFAKLPDCLKRSANPGLIVSSSDIATSAITMQPCLLMASGAYVPLTECIKVEHTGENIAGRVAASLECLLAYFEDNSEKIAELEKINIANGLNVLKRCFKEFSGIPKRPCAADAVENFEIFYPAGTPTTAMDIYLAVVDAYVSVVANFPGNMLKQFSAADTVARVAAMETKWSEFDVAGEVNW